MPTLQRSKREGKEFVQDYVDSEWEPGSNSGLPDTSALNYHPLLPSCPSYHQLALLPCWAPAAGISSLQARLKRKHICRVFELILTTMSIYSFTDEETQGQM